MKKDLEELKKKLQTLRRNAVSGEQLGAMSLKFNDIKTANRMFKAASDAATEADALEKEIKRLEAELE